MDTTTDTPASHRCLDVLGVFDPVQCRSLKYVKRELEDMAPGEVLEVLGNRFQHREIEVWAKRFGHAILGRTDRPDGNVLVYIRHGGAP